MNKISLFFGIVSAVFLLWVLLSWVDVVSDNMSENPTHSKYNAFVMLTDAMEGEQ